MRELSLFTGAGGGLLGTMLLGWEHIGYVEYDHYCQKIIKQRIEDGILDAAPIYGDIRKFISEGYAEAYQGMADVITAGFPCQPFSVAGKRAGEDDERNMWPATIGCIRIIRPEYALLENVPGLLSSGYFQRILGDLAEAGYDAEWCVLGASDIGANHHRKRLWVLAYTNGKRSPGDLGTEIPGRKRATPSYPEPCGRSETGNTLQRACKKEDVADTGTMGCRERPTGLPERKTPIGTQGNQEPCRRSEGEGDVSNAETIRLQGCAEENGLHSGARRRWEGEFARGNSECGGWWSTEPDVWVEWLMGWPLGWTDLKPLETDRFRQWLERFGG